MKKKDIIQNRIIKDIFSLIESQCILEKDLDSCELFYLWYHTRSLSYIINNHKIAKENRQAASVSLGIMYVNMCILYAKFNLTPEQYDNFFAFICLDYSNRYFGYAWPNITYSKQGKDDYIIKSFVKIELSECKLYEQIKDVVGLSDFECYYRKPDYGGFEYYLVPKSMSHLIE